MNFLHVDWIDLIDILAVALLIQRGLQLIRGTRAVPMLAGLTIVILAYLAARVFGLVTLDWLLGNFLSSIILVVVVIFQDEIRRGLTKMGLQPFTRGHNHSHNRVVEDVSLVAERLAQEGMGGLIVFQREVGLDDFLEDAIEIDSVVNRKLLYSLFLKQSPLHDGAVLIVADRIKAASCVLPLSFNPDIDPNLGTRHRAALGLSERSDALTVVISEETSTVSLVFDGKIIRNLDAVTLREEIALRLLGKSAQIAEEEQNE
jgi:diadenylate cyclase